MTGPDTSSTAVKKRITELKQSRGQNKRFLTRLEEWLAKDVGDEFDIDTRLENLERQYQQFNVTQGELEALGDTDVDKDLELFESKYMDLQAKLRRLKHSKTGASSVSNSGSATPTQASPIPPSPVQVEVVTQDIVFPKLKKFSGESYMDFPSFINSFKALVNSPKNNMTILKKFSILRDSLEGRAFDAIRHLVMSDENYEPALEILNERFYKPRLIFDSLMQTLTDVPRSTGPDSLRKILDNINAILNAVKGLDATSEQIGYGILIHTTLTKLDNNTVTKWNEESCQKADALPNWKEFAEFLEKRANTLEAVNFLNPKKEVTDKIRNNFKTKRAYTTSITGQPTCAVCRGSCTLIAYCKLFQRQDAKERYNWVKANHYCLRCLNKYPHAEKCNASRCQDCNGRHHTLLHFGSYKPANPSTASPNNFTGTTPLSALTVNQQGSVEKQQILATAMVKLQARDGTWIMVRALIDGGSMVHFITKRMAAKLNLKLGKHGAPIIGICGGKEIRQSSNVNMRALYGSCEEHLHVLVLPEFNHLHPSTRLNRESMKIPHNVALADPTYDVPQQVDLIIGVGLAYKLLMVGQIRLDDNLLLQKTTLGWLVAGELDSQYGNHNKLSLLIDTGSHEHEDLEGSLKKFWELERIPNLVRKWSPTETFCEEHFRTFTTRNEAGRFIVRLPINVDSSKLGNSFGMARRRLTSVENKLKIDPEFKRLYCAFMDEYEKLGHMIELKNADPENINYLPHHGVLKPDSTSTKLRVVFDASAATSSGLSLNEVMPHGPTIQPPLFRILLHFRYHKVALSGDITKMYRQILVHPDDRHLQCILWRREGESHLTTFMLTTVTYGTSSAPFLATRCLDELTRTEIGCPRAKEALQHYTYVDNTLFGANTAAEVNMIRQELTDLLSKGCMEMRKWCSNDPEVMQSISEPDQESLTKIADDDVIKTLGLFWNPVKDTFVFTHHPPETKKWTKRKIVSYIAKIFDPLGLLGPVVTRLKIFTQQLWLIKLNWDESLTQEAVSRWQKLMKDLPVLNEIKIPRYVFHDESKVVDYQLHCFADASALAYGTVLYVRCTLDNGDVIIRNLCSRSRVAPLKKVTLPRLELCGASLLAELFTTVWPTLSNRVTTVYCWLDAQVALTWVTNSPHKYSDFIANRVTAIQDKTAGCIWRHVKGTENPADILSRGATPHNLMKYSEWLNGPKFLLRNPEEWQTHAVSPLADDDPDLETRKFKFALYTKLDTDIVANYKYHNDILRTQKTFAYVARFIASSKGSFCSTSTYMDINLTALDLEAGLGLAVKAIQVQSFHQDYMALRSGKPIAQKSSLIRLSPFLDKNGIMRVGGRLTNAKDLTFDERHPMLIPKNHPFATALMYKYHWTTLHTGPQALLAAIRRKFWPIGGRTLANKIYRECIPCRIFARQAYTQVMADLPFDRISKFERCFETVGLDLCGPFTIKHYGRGTPRTTMYIAVFICFRTKAVQLQYVMGTDTNSIINAITRFIAQANIPRVIWSDNATNFHGADGVLKVIDWKRIDTWCRDTHRIQWKFIPARSPHHGGLWEAAVKSAKKHLYKVMKNTVLHQDAFITLLAKIEIVLNNRPCVPLAINPVDGQPLTPSHFKNGGPILDLPDPTPADFTSTQRSLVETWLHLTEIKQHWVKRWLEEVRQQLQTREKWHSGSPDIKVGQIVMMIDRNSKTPYTWTTARISRVFRNQRDQRIRVVEVTTPISGGEPAVYERAITELVPIFTEEETKQRKCQN